ncbi:MAG: hypothetical protein OEQ53_14800 [Saprospiraceae bacterium]|nr:hypothetical protein [Saprospiraceae bacterium]
MQSITMGAQSSLLPEDLSPVSFAVIESGNLSLTFVDNQRYGQDHRAGYNGIAEMTHAEQDSSIFVPQYAGFNLEHIFGGDSLIELFEPRKFPMKVFQPDRDQVWLYQAPTPLSQMETLTKFKVSAPHYIDVVFRCVVHSDAFFTHDYAGLFWASYIHNPSDKRIYFYGKETNEEHSKWIKAFSEEHGVNSTHVADRKDGTFYFAPNFNARLASHFSNYQFEDPFYFGRFHNMVLAYLFDTEEVIRFSQSPTGGGPLNPAWDFQFLIPEFSVGQEYSFQARMVYKPFIDAADIRNEYRGWKNSLH